MAKRKQKVKRITKTTKTSKSQRLQNISNIKINIGKDFSKKDDRVTLAPTKTSSTTYLPTAPSNTILLEAPNRLYSNVPEPLRRYTYATLPAVSNPITVQPVVNGSARDHNPAIGVPIIQAGNINDLSARQSQSTLVKNRDIIPNLSLGTSMLSTPSRSFSSTPNMTPPQSMLTPRQHSFSGMDLLERNPNEASRPIDIQQANAVQRSFVIKPQAGENIRQMVERLNEPLQSAQASASNLSFFPFSSMGSPFYIPQESGSARLEKGRPRKDVEITRPFSGKK